MRTLPKLSISNRRTLPNQKIFQDDSSLKSQAVGRHVRFRSKWKLISLKGSPFPPFFNPDLSFLIFSNGWLSSPCNLFFPVVSPYETPSLEIKATIKKIVSWNYWWSKPLAKNCMVFPKSTVYFLWSFPSTSRVRMPRPLSFYLSHDTYSLPEELQKETTLTTGSRPVGKSGRGD